MAGHCILGEPVFKSAEYPLARTHSSPLFPPPAPGHRAGMPGSPPGLLYMPPGPGPFVPHPHHGANGHDAYGMHAAYGIHPQQQQQQQADFVQHMAGMSLSQQQQPGLAQQEQQGARPGSSSGSAGAAGGRSEGRASARIARSHRAGGAYNPAEVGGRLSRWSMVLPCNAMQQERASTLQRPILRRWPALPQTDQLPCWCRCPAVCV